MNYYNPYYEFAQPTFTSSTAPPTAPPQKSSFGIAEGPLSNKFILILVIFAAIGGVVFFLFWLTGSVESPASTDTADSFGGSTASSQS